MTYLDCSLQCRESDDVTGRKMLCIKFCMVTVPRLLLESDALSLAPTSGTTCLIYKCSLPRLLLHIFPASPESMAGSVLHKTMSDVMLHQSLLLLEQWCEPLWVHHHSKICRSNYCAALWIFCWWHGTKRKWSHTSGNQRSKFLSWFPLAHMTMTKRWLQNYNLLSLLEGPDTTKIHI